MSDNLTLPICFAPQAYPGFPGQMIKEICTPLDRAVPGDIVAIDLRFVRMDGFIELLPVTQVFTLEKSIDPHKFKQQTPRTLPARQLARIAVPIIQLQHQNLYAGIFEGISERLNLQVAEFVDILMMPDLAVVTRDEYIDQVFAIQHDRKVTQEAVDQALLALYFHQPKTAHEMIEINHDLLQLLDIVNKNCPVPDPDDFDKDGILALPPLDKVQTL